MSLRKRLAQILCHAGEVRCDAQMFCSPVAHSVHDRDELVTGIGQRVIHVRGNGLCGVSADYTVVFELPQLRGQDLFADAGEQIADFHKSAGAEGQMPDGQNFPFASKYI